eukprot:4524495-Karenia_brevis.AAC.1
MEAGHASPVLFDQLSSSADCEPDVISFGAASTGILDFSGPGVSHAPPVLLDTLSMSADRKPDVLSCSAASKGSLDMSGP